MMGKRATGRVRRFAHRTARQRQVLLSVYPARTPGSELAAPAYLEGPELRRRAVALRLGEAAHAGLARIQVSQSTTMCPCSPVKSH